MATAYSAAPFAAVCPYFRRRAFRPRGRPWGFSLSLWDYPIPHAFNHRLWPACPRLGIWHTLKRCRFLQRLSIQSVSPGIPLWPKRRVLRLRKSPFQHCHNAAPCRVPMAIPTCLSGIPIRRLGLSPKLLKTAATQVSSPPHSRLSRRTAVRQSQRRFDVYLQQLSPSNRIRGTVFSD